MVIFTAKSIKHFQIETRFKEIITYTLQRTTYF